MSQLSSEQLDLLVVPEDQVVRRAVSHTTAAFLLVRHHSLGIHSCGIDQLTALNTTTARFSNQLIETTDEKGHLPHRCEG